MGMYTGFSMNVVVRDLPAEVLESKAFCCQSSYFWACEVLNPEDRFRLVPTILGKHKGHEICALSFSGSLKDYDHDIKTFLQQIEPYIDEENEGNCIGWYRYEEYGKPTMLYFYKGKIEEITPPGSYEE